jgi:hypothetical protein
MEAAMQQKAPFPLPTFEHYRPALDAAMWSTERAVKAALEFQLESLRFAAKRAHCNLEFMRQLCHCQEGQEAFHLQRNWWNDATADYGEEWGRIVGVGLDVAKGTFAPLQGMVTPRAPQAADIRRAA